MTELRVLLVEDSEDDTLLLERHLRQGGIEISVQRVETAAQMKAALESATWDVIISDYSLPCFTGEQALEVYRQHGSDAPFLVVSGAIGEETAVGMMRAGAHDYVMKDRLNRLAEAVKRELRAAQERRARKETERANARLAALVESCDDAVIGKTLDGIVTSWNKAAERMYGYTAAEMLGRSMSTLIPASRAREQLEICELLKEGRQVDGFETVRLRKGGGTVEVGLTVSPIMDEHGRVTGASVVARDISKAKQDERDRLRLIEELSEALRQVKTLTGLLPICSGCKRIRDDEGYWKAVETFLSEHSYAHFTHGICPECAQTLYPEYASKLTPP